MRGKYLLLRMHLPLQFLRLETAAKKAQEKKPFFSFVFCFFGFSFGLGFCCFFLLFWFLKTEVRNMQCFLLGFSLAGAEDGAEGEHTLLDGHDLSVELVKLLVRGGHVAVRIAAAVDVILTELKSGAEAAELVHDLVFLKRGRGEAGHAEGGDSGG